MKKIILLFLVLIGCKPKQIENQQKINVLFIGNSLTYYHDMTKTLQVMLDENNSKYNIEQSAFPGMTLKGHLEDIITETKGEDVYTREKEAGETTETEKKLKSKKWDVIILQEGTGRLYYSEVIKEVINPSIKSVIDFNNNLENPVKLTTTFQSKLTTISGAN